MFGTDNEQERGQVGIGTLIVFIALVLVAAIAAGVLINTAGFLQSQAEATGEESTAQVANNLDFVSAYGTWDHADNTDGDSVTGVTVEVQLAPGSDPINLEDATVEVFIAGGDRVEVTPEATILEPGETEVLFEDDTNDDSAEVDLEPGDSAEIVVTTDDGSQAETVISVPDPVTQDDETTIRL